MRRREFLGVLGGAAAATSPFAARAQPTKILQVGFLYPGVQIAAPSRITALASGLQAGGLRAGQFEIVPRVANGNSALMGPLAADLVERKVDLIFAASPVAARAARAATSAIPIVVGDLESDPAESGFFASNARPGGNVTGTYLDFPDFSKKWLEALKEAVPQVTNVASIWDPATAPTQLKAVETAAVPLRFRLAVFEVKEPKDIEPAFVAARQNSGAVLMLSSPVIGSTTKMSAQFALTHQLPAITLFTDFARDGGLMAYGPNLLAFIRQGGVMAAKILLGANPAETPIETPAKFEFVLNLKTAQVLGLTIPASLLLRADEVIE